MCGVIEENPAGALEVRSMNSALRNCSKIGRLVDLKPRYTLEVAVCRGEFGQP